MHRRGRTFACDRRFAQVWLPDAGAGGSVRHRANSPGRRSECDQVCLTGQHSPTRSAIDANRSPFGFPRPHQFVALGSSSTAGRAASSAEATYPSRLMVELAHRFRNQSIMVLNRGVSGERAVDMLARFDESVAAERPDLVLWQVGTNAVLRGYEHSKSNSLIRDGIRRMKAIGADVVLIDPQFAPKVIAKPEIEDMVDLISRAAKQENVDVFPLCSHAALARHRWYAIRGIPFAGWAPYERLEL